MRRVHNTVVPRVRVVVCRASERARDLQDSGAGIDVQFEGNFCPGTFRAAEIERDAARLQPSYRRRVYIIARSDKIWKATLARPGLRNFASFSAFLICERETRVVSSRFGNGFVAA